MDDVKRGFVMIAAVLGIACGPAAQAADLAPDQVARGKYLVTAGGCVACHTAPGGTPLAGGLYVDTPFGQIPSPNLTPDRETGIGAWTDDQFYRAMHEGIGGSGEYLYPAFPFTSYTKVTRDDVLAIKAYLFSLPPAHAPRKPNRLPFPYNIRLSLLGWRTLFFHAGTFQPDPKQSAEINRGAYLVEGLGHCAECHSTRNALGGREAGTALAGGEVDGWYAPNLTSDMREGIGGWSDAQLATFLHTGASPQKGVVIGPMTDVVHESLSKLSDADVDAITAYLKSVPAKETDAQARAAGAAPVRRTGEAIYGSFCSSCHQPDGRGLPGAVPPLAGNGAVMAAGPQNVIQAVLGGFPAQASYAVMPGFSADLTNAQIAAVADYVRGAWGNATPQNATLEEVAQARRTTHAPLSGSEPACPAAAHTAASDAVADPKSGVRDLFAGMDDGNVVERVDDMLARVHAAAPTAGKADIINALSEAYCPMLAAERDTSLVRKRWELNRLTQLAFVALTQETAAAR